MISAVGRYGRVDHFAIIYLKKRSSTLKKGFAPTIISMLFQLWHHQRSGVHANLGPRVTFLLIVGCWAVGCSVSVLVAGCWLIATGCKLLAAVCGLQDTACCGVLESKVVVVGLVACQV